MPPMQYQQATNVQARPTTITSRPPRVTEAAMRRAVLPIRCAGSISFQIRLADPVKLNGAETTTRSEARDSGLLMMFLLGMVKGCPPPPQVPAAAGGERPGPEKLEPKAASCVRSRAAPLSVALGLP